MAFTITTITHATAWKRHRAYKAGAASGPRGTTMATGAARSLRCGCGSCPASLGSRHPHARRGVWQRRATHEQLGRRLGGDGGRGWLEQRRLACRTGRVFGQGTAKRQQRPQTHQTEAQRAEDVGSQDVFIAGVIYTLSRQLLPGAPYAPGLSGSTVVQRSEREWWKLDECLRCALRSSRLDPPSG